MVCGPKTIIAGDFTFQPNAFLVNTDLQYFTSAAPIATAGRFEKLYQRECAAAGALDLKVPGSALHASSLLRCFLQLDG